MHWTARLPVLTDGLRIYCGKASTRLRKASSAPALFILVRVLVRVPDYCYLITVLVPDSSYPSKDNPNIARIRRHAYVQ